MTNEEAIKMLKSKMDGHTDTSYEWAETVRMAIKALEQQPCERFEWGIDGNVYKITKAKDGKEICQQVCNDAISREAFIKRYDEWMYSEYGKHCEKDALAIRVANSLPPVTQKYGKWIKRTDRLPEDKTYVLTTIKVPNRVAHARSGWYECGSFHNDNGDTWRATDMEVKAWMPLPEPYEPQERSDKG